MNAPPDNRGHQDVQADNMKKRQRRRNSEIWADRVPLRQADQVRRMVVGQGMTLALVGVVIGLGASFGLAQVITSFLFGVKARDPFAFTAVPLVLALVAFVAVWLPARRASKVDPIIALRVE